MVKLVLTLFKTAAHCRIKSTLKQQSMCMAKRTDCKRSRTSFLSGERSDNCIMSCPSLLNISIILVLYEFQFTAYVSFFKLGLIYHYTSSSLCSLLSKILYFNIDILEKVNNNHWLPTSHWKKTRIIYLSLECRCIRIHNFRYGYNEMTSCNIATLIKGSSLTVLSFKEMKQQLD